VEKGDRVEFQIQDNDGTERAVEIIRKEDRLTGAIIHSGKGYGFIEVDERFEDNQRVFFSYSDVIPDAIGRRAMPIGTRVSFAVEMKGGKERAFDVQNEDPSLSPIDPTSYREYGSVHWFSDDRGYITRPNGDSLIFLTKNVVSEGIESIKQGTWLYYGINRHTFLFDRATQKFRHRVYAENICVCLAEPGSVEQFFLTAPELPLDEPTVPVSPVYTSVLLSPNNRAKTLRQLIAEKKIAA
jgi:cold shock CspA family protein